MTRANRQPIKLQINWIDGLNVGRAHENHEQTQSVIAIDIESNLALSMKLIRPRDSRWLAHEAREGMQWGIPEAKHVAVWRIVDVGYSFERRSLFGKCIYRLCNNNVICERYQAYRCFNIYIIFINRIIYFLCIYFTHF